MHNLHYIVVRAENGDDACAFAEQVLDWGNENNWCSFGGAISESNMVYVSIESHARWKPHKSDTFRSIEAELEIALKPRMNKKEAHALWIECNCNNDPSSWHTLSEHIRLMIELTHLPKDRSIKNGFELYPNQFDRFGITNFTYMSDEHEQWIVYLDMHSQSLI